MNPSPLHFVHGPPCVEGGGKGNSGSFVILSGPWCACGVTPVPEARKGTVLHSIPRSGWVYEGESPLRAREQAAPFLLLLFSETLP